LGEPVASADGITVYEFISDDDARSRNMQAFAMDVGGTFIYVRVFRANDLTQAVNGLLAFEFKSLTYDSSTETPSSG